MTEALVYKKGIAAASLVSIGGRTTFCYLPEYLQSDLPAVASSLPKVIQEITLSGGATPAFFTGLLPEGQRLVAMRDRVKTSLSDDLGLLLDIGADLIGDVQVLPMGVDPAVEREVFKLPGDSSELSFAQIRDQVFGSRASGLPGVQDKVSSKMLNAPVRYAGYDYILKLNPVGVDLAVENEHLVLSKARACGIDVAAADLLTDRHGEHALRLRRFDRQVIAEKKHRLAQEDAAQVMNIYPSAKYDVEFLAMANTVIELCSAMPVAALKLFRLLVFSYLIGNGDAHAKNFSILEGSSGEWRVAPAYDLLCTRFYDDRTMALKLFGEERGWNRELLLRAATELGIPEKLAAKTIDHQLAVLADFPDQVRAGILGFPQHLRLDVGRFLRERAKALAQKD